MKELDSAVTRLISTLGKLGPPEHPDYALVKPHCRLIAFEPGALLHDPQQPAESVYFIYQGLVRVFNINESGDKEFNKSFVVEGQFIAALISPLHAEPSPYYVQALEPVLAIAINRIALDRLYQKSIVWANVGRVYMEHLAIRKEQREAQLLIGSAEQRYKRFVAESPELIGRVHYYHIASYLGITDVALSRIRRRLNQS